MKKIYNVLFYTSFFMAIFSVYCKILVSCFDILAKNDNILIIAFCIGIFVSIIIVLLLRYLFRQKQA